MLESGSEVYRTEDTITRIATNLWRVRERLLRRLQGFSWAFVPVIIRN